jgi:hypothetical protein
LYRAWITISRQHQKGETKMLVTFQSKVGRITMHGDVAVQMIRMMGRTGSVPSALLVSDIPEAITLLQEAIETEEATQSKDNEAAEENSGISLRHRVLPLLTLLQDAAREGSDVMWEQAGPGPLQF